MSGLMLEFGQELITRRSLSGIHCRQTGPDKTGAEVMHVLANVCAPYVVMRPERKS